MTRGRVGESLPTVSPPLQERLQEDRSSHAGAHPCDENSTRRIVSLFAANCLSRPGEELQRSSDTRRRHCETATITKHTKTTKSILLVSFVCLGGFVYSRRRRVRRFPEEIRSRW